MPILRSGWRGLASRPLIPILAAGVAAAAPHAAPAQQSAAPVDSAAQQSPVGTWRGTSICTPGHPACHDETVVYRIRAAGARFEISASKIVAGQEEFMGTIQCDYAAATHVLDCPTSYGVWNFTISGAGMTGTLVARGELYRRVTVSRARG
jgi:hypothetical protein